MNLLKHTFFCYFFVVVHSLDNLFLLAVQIGVAKFVD